MCGSKLEPKSKKTKKALKKMKMLHSVGRGGSFRAKIPSLNAAVDKVEMDYESMDPFIYGNGRFCVFIHFMTQWIDLQDNIVLDSSRPKNNNRNIMANNEPPPPPQVAAAAGEHDDAEVEDNEKHQFWEAVAVYPTRDDDSVACKRRFLLPFHTKSLSSVLSWSPNLQQLLRTHLHWHVFVDQSWDFTRTDWEQASASLGNMGNTLVSHCLGLTRQRVQCLAESTINMVRSAIQTQLKPQQRVAWKTSIDINWSMSRELYFCIQDQFNRTAGPPQ
jgi:hypothetical protein